MRLTCLFMLVSLPCLMAAKKKKIKQIKQPHIMFIMADDMGWGDVGWSEYPEIPTPRLMEMRQESLELTQFYSQPKCTAARAALMTARYPYKMGLQTDNVFSYLRNNTLPEDEKLLPAYLKDLGYTNHIVGKWHLGNCNERVAPTGRGFDSFFGSWGNTKDYFNHITGRFYNWISNTTINWDVKGTYNTFLITNHTQHLLREHFGHKATARKPLFMYIPYLAPHLPVQVPKKYIRDTNCSRIDRGDIRRTYCGMVAALDEGVGNITDTMRQLGVIDDFIIIVTSDNGAAYIGGASSWPLRGSKQTILEGGTRVRTLLRAPKFLRKKTGEYTGLVHMTDVLPTLYQAAGGNVKRLPKKMDGMSAWTAIRKGKPTSRKWMVYNIDKTRSLGAIRMKTATHDFKLVYQDSNTLAGWQRIPQAIMKKEGRVRPKRVPIRDNVYRLFDLTTNPEERDPSSEFPDAAIMFPKVFSRMKSRLRALTKSVVDVPPYSVLPDDHPSHPKQNNGAWGVGGC